ncbi:TRAP transporter large permease [Pseudooceanicola sp. HF7]|uniref:TRAP transporter large permease n=1 Tax=Pseudooceanicola sp. HF7 TaxID=2721560 RepID=UPI0014301594|nr:TRAP transporter large permease [Pseudooceanicola sp. HF7]NIZ10587.1 TRAP transporter large permease [Pseudooceanicola sp. HF7]
MTIALIGFAILFILLFLGLPVGIGMLLIGTTGFAWIIGGLDPALQLLARTAWTNTTLYSMSVLPLFILMGDVIGRTGIGGDLYRCANAFVGHWRGGLAVATVGASGGFAAVTGSSLATAASMSQIAYPEMKRHGYSDSLAAGAIAAGGTLGVLIPPSVVFVFYGILTGNDIGMLFVAGILPGLIGLLLYVGAVAVSVRLKPSSGPAGEKSNWAQRLSSLRPVSAVAALFLLVIGGIYLGAFTATEAAGIGAGGAILIAFLKGRLPWHVLRASLLETAFTTTVLFTVIVGALVFGNFINVSGLPRELSSLITQFELSPLWVLACILAIYMVLGCVLESTSMVLLTVPVFYPVVTSLGIDPIWFGVLVVCMVEVSMITPPIGMNVILINSLLPSVPLQRIFAGVAAFVLADVIRLIILIAFPQISTWLPYLM